MEKKSMVNYKRKLLMLKKIQEGVLKNNNHQPVNMIET
jgi:hypothetical protein